jgi:hypothetical protein
MTAGSSELRVFLQVLDFGCPLWLKAPSTIAGGRLQLLPSIAAGGRLQLPPDG